MSPGKKMRWFRGGSDPVTAVRSDPMPVPGRCSERSCHEARVYRCEYSDRHGDRCPVLLCRSHLGSLEQGIALCRRHRAVAAAIETTAGSILEVTRPDLDDRSFGLLLVIRDNVQDSMLALLRKRADRSPGIEVAPDSTVRGVRRGAEMGWELGWSAFSATGPLARIGLRVPAMEPPNVQLLVNRRVVLEGTPDWIAKRLSGQNFTDADHSNYFHRLTTAADLGLSRLL